MKFVAYLDLNQIEKIKRKGKEARHPAPLGLSAQPAQSRARALPPALSALAGPPVSAAASRAPASALLSLSARGPGLSAPSSPRNRRPSYALPPSPRPRRAWSSQPPAPSHLSPEPHSPSPPPPFALQQTPLPPLPRCSHARAPPPQIPAVPSSFPRRRWSSAVPPATVSFASASATRDTPQFLFPLPISLCPRSPAVLHAAAEVRHRRPGPPSRRCRHRGVPGVRLEVRNLSRPLPTFVLPPVAFDCSPEPLLRRRRAASPWTAPSGAPAPT